MKRNQPLCTRYTYTRSSYINKCEWNECKYMEKCMVLDSIMQCDSILYACIAVFLLQSLYTNVLKWFVAVVHFPILHCVFDVHSFLSCFSSFVFFFCSMHRDYRIKIQLKKQQKKKITL